MLPCGHSEITVPHPEFFSTIAAISGVQFNDIDSHMSNYTPQATHVVTVAAAFSLNSKTQKLVLDNVSSCLLVSPDVRFAMH